MKPFILIARFIARAQQHVALCDPVPHFDADHIVGLDKVADFPIDHIECGFTKALLQEESGNPFKMFAAEGHAPPFRRRGAQFRFRQSPTELQTRRQARLFQVNSQSTADCLRTSTNGNGL